MRGRPANEATAVVAANRAIEGARPLRFNAYKVPLMRISSSARSGARPPHEFPDLGSRPLGPADPDAHFLGSLWASLFAGVAFLVAHASYMVFSAHRKRHADETDAMEAAHADLPRRIVRHSLAARMFHWVMAAAMFTLLLTAFLPIAGVRFAWVTWHWVPASS